MNRMPGGLTPEQTIDRIVRVDQAGEYGAVRIYEGQLAVLPEGPAKQAVRKMLEQEKAHLAEFNKLMVDRRARPTALQPLWHVAGFALGAATALMGEKAAMACTAAVEEVIDQHYAAQVAKLGDSDPKLKETVEDFRAEEIAHRDAALAMGAEEAPGYRLLSEAIKAGCRVAIRLSEKI